MNIGNLKSSALFTDMQGSNIQQNLFLKGIGEHFSELLKWVYEFTQPFAAEAGKSFQVWWDGQKAAMMNTAVQWLVNQHDNLSTSLQSLLTSAINNSTTPH